MTNFQGRVPAVELGEPDPHSGGDAASVAGRDRAERLARQQSEIAPHAGSYIGRGCRANLAQGDAVQTHDQQR